MLCNLSSSNVGLLVKNVTNAFMLIEFPAISDWNSWPQKIRIGSGRKMFLNPWYSGQQPQNGVGGHPPTVTPPENGPMANGNVNHVTNLTSHVTNHVTRSPAPSPRLLPRSLDNRNQQVQQVEEVQRRLRTGWTVHMTADGRYYYCK